MNGKPLWSGLIALTVIALGLGTCREMAGAALPTTRMPKLKPTFHQVAFRGKIVFDRERRVPFSDEIPLPVPETDISVLDVRADGPRTRVIYTELGDRCGGARWSPDGTRIAFYGTGNEAHNPSAALQKRRALARRTDTDSTGARRRLARPHEASGAESLNLEHAIPHLVEREPGDLNIDIWTMSADGSDVRQLTDSDVDDFSPSWSPDGERIVWVHGGSLWIMSSDGVDAQPLLERDAQTLHTSPDWSPDGEQILFTTRSGDDTDMYLIKPDGRGLTQVDVPSGHSPLSPRWSPNGARITYFLYDRTVRIFPVNRRYYSVHTMDADGTNGISIAEPGDLYLTAPPSSFGPSDWMPDGSTVALIQDYSERAMLRAVRPYGPEPTEWFIVPDGIAEWYEVDGIDVYVPQ